MYFALCRISEHTSTSFIYELEQSHRCIQMLRAHKLSFGKQFLLDAKIGNFSELRLDTGLGDAVRSAPHCSQANGK